MLMFSFINLQIKLTPNNIAVILQDPLGKLLYYVTAGSVGYKGRQKHTRTACRTLLLQIWRKLRHLSTTNLNIYLKGAFKWRRHLIKLFVRRKICIKSITEVPVHPHNGCRLPKKKRK